MLSVYTISLISSGIFFSFLQDLQETFTVNTLGPLLMGKYFSPLLGAGNGAFGRQAQNAKEKHAAVLVNMSARVGSIGGEYYQVGIIYVCE